MEGHAEVLLSDTVGFVRHLPHQLVASFKATLEEAVNADLLLHVVDASNAEVFEQITSVDAVLAEIGCGQKEKLVLLNKTDVLGKASLLESLQTVYRQAICISAKTGMNLDKLAETVLAKFRGGQVTVRVNCSAGNGRVQSFLRASATILKRQYLDSSVTIEARLGKNQLPLLKRLEPKGLEVIEN
jgi:GTP-binding protein HflX